MGMNKQFYFLPALMIILISCATQYRASYWKGGYSEQQLSETGYKVTFSGNGYTSSTRVANYLLLRCAELTLQNGYEYFLIVGNSGNKNTSYSYDDLTDGIYSVNKHTKSARIYMADKNNLSEDELKRAINARVYWENYSQ